MQTLKDTFDHWLVKLGVLGLSLGVVPVYILSRIAASL